MGKVTLKLSKISTSTKHLLTLITDKKTNPLRRASLIKKIIEEENVAKKDLAQMINKSPSFISNYLRLLQLPDVVKDALLSGIISEGHSRALSFLESRREMIEVFENIIRHNYSVRATEAVVNKLRKAKRAYGRVSLEIKQQVKILADKLEVKGEVQRRNNNILIKLYFPVSIVGFRKIRKLVEKL